MYIDFTQEVPTATAGDTLLNSAKGLTLFPSGGLWYSKDSSGVVKALAGVASFNTRSGAVTLTKADVTGTGLAASDIGAPAGSGTSTGTNTGDQTITLTGDVTGSGSGSFAATIAGGAVTSAKMAAMAANTVKANLTGGSATPTDATTTALTAALNAATVSLQGMLSPSHFKFISAIDGAQFINVQANAYSNLACDGSTDDTAALNALLAAAPDGSTLQWPLQNTAMVLTSAAVIPGGKHFNFVGGEDGKTVWLQTSPTADHLTCGDWYSTFTGIQFSTINTTTTSAGQALTSGTVLAVVAIPSLSYVAASGTINVGSSAGWQTLTYSARTSTTVTLSQTGTGTTVVGAPLAFKTAGAAINAGNFVGIDAINCSATCVFNGYIASGSTANASVVDNWGGLNTINFNVQIDAANWNGIITNCTGDCTVNSRTLCHLEINQAGAITGQNNQWIRGQYDMRLGSTTAAYPAGVFSIYFNNCFYDNAGTDAVKIQGISAVQRVKLTDSWLSSAQGGMGLNLASTASTLPTDINLSNCNIYSNSTNGIGGNGAQDISITNCQIAGNATAGVNAGVPKLHASDNRIGPVGGIGANGTGVILPAVAFTSVSIHDNDLSGNTTAPLTDSSTSIAAADIYRNGGLVTGRTPNPAVTAIALTTVTQTDSRGGLPFPANARPGTKVQCILDLTNAATLQTLTIAVKYGTANTNADTAVASLALSAGTAALGGGLVIVEFTILTSITAACTIRFHNNLAATGISAANTASAGTVSPGVTISTASASFLGVYASSATAAAVSVRSVVWKVLAQ